MDEREEIRSRLTELARRSYEGGYFLFSNFLGLAEQSVLAELSRELRGIHYEKFGGALGAERVMVRFGDPEELGYEQPYPITLIKIEPRDARFAERLGHRDYLGALMNLGIEREVLGDVVVRDGVSYLFCKSDMAEYICSSLARARHTDLRLSVADSLPEGELYKTERRRIQAVGERIDAVVAKVFSISREDSLGYFRKRLVYVNGSLTENNSKVPKQGEIISVRGLGRFKYLGYETTSKKGKLNIEVDLFV